jgi:uncharacterized membrane protein
MESPETMAAGYLARNRSVDIGRCISRGINLVTGNLGLVVGSCLLALVIMLGINLVPILGWIASFVIDPVLVAGLYMILVKRLRGQEATVSDLFAPFNTSALHLALANLLTTALVAIGFICLILPGIYLAVSYVFALPLVADKKIEFWPAMELSRRVVTRYWFSVFALLIVAFLFAIMGVLAVIVGVVITAPIALASLAVAYEELFGDGPAAAVAIV